MAGGSMVAEVVAGPAGDLIHVRQRGFEVGLDLLALEAACQHPAGPAEVVDHRVPAGSSAVGRLHPWCWSRTVRTSSTCAAPTARAARDPTNPGPAPGSCATTSPADVEAGFVQATPSSARSMPNPSAIRTRTSYDVTSCFPWEMVRTRLSVIPAAAAIAFLLNPRLRRNTNSDWISRSAKQSRSRRPLCTQDIHHCGSGRSGDIPTSVGSNGLPCEPRQLRDPFTIRDDADALSN